MTVRELLDSERGRAGYAFGAQAVRNARERGVALTTRRVGDAAWQAAGYDGYTDADRRLFAEGAERGAMDARTSRRSAAARLRLGEYAPGV